MRLEFSQGWFWWGLSLLLVGVVAFIALSWLVRSDAVYLAQLVVLCAAVFMILRAFRLVPVESAGTAGVPARRSVWAVYLTVLGSVCAFFTLLLIQTYLFLAPGILGLGLLAGALYLDPHRHRVLRALPGVAVILFVSAFLSYHVVAS